MAAENFLIIDESGDLFSPNAETKIVDLDKIQILLRNIKLTDSFSLETNLENEVYIVEAFDHPLLVQRLENHSGKILLQTQYQMLFDADVTKFSVDDQDRFCGLTTSGAPFRLTAKAQERLFNDCDEYENESDESEDNRGDLQIQPVLRQLHFFRSLFNGNFNRKLLINE